MMLFLKLFIVALMFIPSTSLATMAVKHCEWTQAPFTSYECKGGVYIFKWRICGYIALAPGKPFYPLSYDSPFCHEDFYDENNSEKCLSDSTPDENGCMEMLNAGKLKRLSGPIIDFKNGPDKEEFKSYNTDEATQ